MNERILILSPFFHPEPISTGKYNTYMARALAQKGVSVDVICLHPFYPQWRPQCSEAGISGVGIYRGGAWIRYPKGNLMRRVMLETGYLLHVLRHAHRFKNYSQIVAILPPMLFLPLVRLAAGPNVRVTAIVHDLQGIMAGLSLSRGRSKMVGLIRLLELMVLKCCHRVIALSNGMASYLTGSYDIPSSKITVCWPFITMNHQHQEGRLSHLFAEDKKHVVYAGALGEKQNPEGLISFFLDLTNRRNDVVCHVFSGGPIFEVYRQNISVDRGQLVFHDLVPEEDLYELYQRSHVQVIPEMIGFAEGAIPSKLPNILSSGAPILYIGQRNSDVWQIIHRVDAGQCADGWDLIKLNVIVDQLLQLYSGVDKEDRRQIFSAKFADLFNANTLAKELTK